MFLVEEIKKNKLEREDAAEEKHFNSFIIFYFYLYRINISEFTFNFHFKHLFT